MPAIVQRTSPAADRGANYSEGPCETIHGNDLACCSVTVGANSSWTPIRHGIGLAFRWKGRLAVRRNAGRVTLGPKETP